MEFLKKINPMAKKKQKKTHISSTIEEVLNKREKEPGKTFVLVCFHKKDKKMIFTCAELKGDVIKLGKTYYYVDSKRIYETEVNKGNTKYLIPYVDIWEGITVAFAPYENIDTRPFTDTFQDVISMHIEKGILENKRKSKVNMQKGIAAGLIGIAAVYIVVKMFIGG